MNIALASPDIGEEEIDLVTKVLRSGMLIQGKYVAALEEKIATFVGVKHAIAVSNGTATLHLILMAMGIGPGDEVIVPAFSYVASANAVELVGARPIFVDIEHGYYNVNPHLIEERLTERTKAIMVVHEFGLAANMNPILEISQRRNIPIIEDAACALGAAVHGRKTGSMGLAGSFSFHPRKAITCGEGGVVTTNDDELAESIRVLRNHGISYINGKMDFIAAGLNYRMTDFQAAMILPQLERLPIIIEKRSVLADQYSSLLSRTNFLLPINPDGYIHSWQTFHILLKKDLNRDKLIEKLVKCGIGTNYGAQCIPATTYYQSKYRIDLGLFPCAMSAYENGLAIPLYEKLNLGHIKYISEQLIHHTHVA